MYKTKHTIQEENFKNLRYVSYIIYFSFILYLYINYFLDWRGGRKEGSKRNA